MSSYLNAALYNLTFTVNPASFCLSTATYVYITHACPTLIIQQHILWFEVSVYDSLLVEVLQALDDLSCIVAGPRLLKPWIVLIHVVDMIPIGIKDTTHF